MLGAVVDVLDPAVLGGRGRLDRRVARVAHRLDRVDDPVHVLLDRDRHVGQHRRAPGPGHHEQVREADRSEAEIGARAVRPLVLQREAVTTSDVDTDERSGHRVESGRVNDRVELQVCAGDVDARLGHGLDRADPEVDETDIRSVERLEVVGVEARPLRTERVGRRAQRLGRVGIVDDRADLVADELGPQIVRGFRRAQVGELAAGCEQLALRPRLLESSEPLVVRHGEDALRRHRHRHTDARPTRGLVVGVPVGFERRPLLVGDRTVAGRHRVVGRPLEHRELIGLRRDVRDRLDRRRAGADDRDALAGEVDALVRPLARQVGLAGESLRAGDVGVLRHRERAGRHHVVTGSDLVAGGGVDVPTRCVLVPDGAVDGGLEPDVTAQVVAVGDVVEVAQDLGLGRVLLRPLPLLFEFRVERVLVVEALDVATGTGVPVPVPGAADVAGRFQGHRRHTDPTELVEQIQPRHPGADHHHVDVHPCTIPIDPHRSMFPQRSRPARAGPTPPRWAPIW